MQAHLSELHSKLQSLDLSSHSNDINVRKLNTVVDKLAKRDRNNDNDSASDVENLEGDARREQESTDDEELISWARTARQIMMDISEIKAPYLHDIVQCTCTVFSPVYFKGLQ